MMVRKQSKRKGIYLDYAASAPVDSAVLRAMMPYFSKEYGNPSSVHRFGQKALAAIDEARQIVAEFLGCEPREIVFTGSATEANNLAIQGIVRSSQSAVRSFTPHIVTSKIEHDSVLETCRALEKEGVEVTYLPVTKDGFVRVEDVKKALKENTVLVSVMYANNEIGTIQPIAEIADAICNFREFRNSNSPNHPMKQLPIFHTDAVQAANYLDCNVDTLGVDLLTLSGHKIYGPKGVGALYVRKGTNLGPLIRGGGQEFFLRSGTENVPAIVGLAAATAEIKNQKLKMKKIESLRDELINAIVKKIRGAKLNGSRENRLPNNANFCFPSVDAENLIIALDQEGIAVSSGSACSTRSIQPSHVLLALGLSEKDARSSIRVTFGKYTTKKEISAFLNTLLKITRRL